MAKINKVNTLQFPTKKGWYWVLIEGYESWFPCWFGYDATDDEEDKCFLPGGMGDSSSCGLYADDINKRSKAEIEEKIFNCLHNWKIERIGPEIIRLCGSGSAITSFEFPFIPNTNFNL